MFGRLLYHLKMFLIKMPVRRNGQFFFPEILTKKKFILPCRGMF